MPELGLSRVSPPRRLISLTATATHGHSHICLKSHEFRTESQYWSLKRATAIALLYFPRLVN